MSYWEVEFLLAEAARLNYITSTAEEHYNEAIEASIMYWGGTEEEVTDYLSRDEVDFDSGVGGTEVQKLALQKWISLYDQGFEAWSTYRYYDYPELPIAAQAMIPTPKRFTYPVTEYSLNEESVRAAESAIGGDALATPVFWDN